MFSFLFECLKHFGLSGLLIYMKIRLSRTKSLRLPGIKHPIAMRANGVDKITFKEIFFKKEYAINLPPSFNPQVIIDAGANIGFTSVYFANRFPNARIFSIEPDKNNYAVLLQNTKLYANITPLNNALWDRRENIQVVDHGYGDRGFMIEKGEGTQTMKAISVTDLMHDHHIATIDILKMDIEGSEKEVFSNGAEQWLSTTKCLIIELHDRMKPGCSQTVFRALNNYDFSLDIKGENLVFMNNTVRM